MGNILAIALIKNPEKSIIQELKFKFTLESAVEIIDKIDEKIGPEEMYVPLMLFKEYFAIYISQVLIEKTNNCLIDESYEKEEALKFELYSILILVSKGSFEGKIQAIYNLFSINEENTLFSQDLILLIKSVVYGIFHLSKIPIPNDEEIIILLNKHFPTVLSDEYFEIEYEEFFEWVGKNEEVHNFLMEFFEMQTRYNAMKSYIKYITEFELIFEANKIEDERKKREILKKYVVNDKLNYMLFSRDESYVSEAIYYCSLQTIMNIVGNMLLKIDPKVQPIFVELIDPEGAGYIRKDRYMKAMKAVSLFMAVDKDMSHSLSKSEMSTLLWLMCGSEPNDNNLNGTLSNLDANGDSAIELREWMDFLATNDHKGKKVLNYSLKQKFDLYDDDGNGNISVDELENMIIDSFQSLIDRAKGDNKIMAENVVRDLAKIIMNKMDDNLSNNLDWSEFKNYLHVASAEEEKIADYIKNIVLN